MKKTLISLALFGALFTQAQECDIHIRVVTPNAESCGGEPAVADLLSNRLINILTRNGITANDGYGQFYISGRFDNLYKETTSGAPMQTVIHTSLTLMVADIFTNKVFDSEIFDLRGVGNGTERAYINALSSLTKSNEKLNHFINRAQTKVINHFDANYPQILANAKTAAAKRNYDEAIFYTSLIPQCSKGYADAENAMLKYYQQYLDHNGAMLLNKARGAFAVSPNAEGAVTAFEYLNQIDPASSSFQASQNLAREIQVQTKVEYDFEYHEKYKDALEIEQRKIDAARQIGVAFGNGQKANTTNILWE